MLGLDGGGGSHRPNAAVGLLATIGPIDGLSRPAAGAAGAGSRSLGGLGPIGAHRRGGTVGRGRNHPGQIEDEVDDVGLLGPGAGLSAQGGGDRMQLVAVLALERRAFKFLCIRAHGYLACLWLEGGYRQGGGLDPMAGPNTEKTWCSGVWHRCPVGSHSDIKERTGGGPPERWPP